MAERRVLHLSPEYRPAARCQTTQPSLAYLQFTPDVKRLSVPRVPGTRLGWDNRAEFVACLTANNAPKILVSRYSSWRGIDIERLLNRHGIKIWDRGLAGDQFVG